MTKKQKVLLGLGIPLATSAIGVAIYFASSSPSKIKTGGESIKPSKIGIVDPIKKIIEDPKKNLDIAFSAKPQDIVFTEKSKINYLAIGDSITEGYTGQIKDIIKGTYNKDSNKLTGNGYPSFLVEYFLRANPSIINNFSNYAVSGSTALEWYSLLTINDKNPFNYEKLAKNDLFSIFGNDVDALSKSLTTKIKEANLITVTLGANDIIKLMISEITKLNIFNLVNELVNSKDLIGDLAKKLEPVISKVFENVKYRLYSFTQKIRSLNDKTEIVFINYPMPMLRIKSVIDGLLNNDNTGEKQAIKISELLLSTINSQLKNVLLLNKTSEQKIRIINLYDDKYWSNHKDMLSPVILDIHPGNKGYKKMAQDLFVAIATDIASNKEAKKYNYLASNEYLKELGKTSQLFDLGVSTDHIAKAVFNNNLEQDLLSTSNLETKFIKLIDNKNNARKMAQYVEWYFLYSKNNQSFFADNFYKIIEGILNSKSFLEIDPTQKVKQYLFANNKANLNEVITLFINSKIIPNLFANFQNNADTLDLDKNNIKGIQEFNLEILKQIAIKSFGDQKTWIEFLKVMLNGKFINTPQNQSQLIDIISTLLNNLLTTKNISKITKIIDKAKLPTDFTKFISNNQLSSLITILVTNSKFKQLLINVASSTIKNVHQIINQDTFTKILTNLLEINQNNISNDLVDLLHELLNNEQFTRLIASIAGNALTKYEEYVPKDLYEKWIPKLSKVVLTVDKQLEISKIIINKFYKYIIDNQFDFFKINTILPELKKELFSTFNKENILKIVEIILKDHKQLIVDNFPELLKDIKRVIHLPKVNSLLTKTLLDYLEKQKIIHGINDYSPLITNIIDLLLNEDLNVLTPIVKLLIDNIQNNKLNLKNINVNEIVNLILPVIKEKFNTQNISNTFNILLNSDLLNKNIVLLKQFVKEVLSNLSSQTFIENLYQSLTTKTNNISTYISQEQFKNIIHLVIDSKQFNDLVDLIFNNIQLFKNADFRFALKTILTNNKQAIKEIVTKLIKSIIDNRDVKDVVVGLLKSFLIKISNDASYRQNVDNLMININKDWDIFASQLKLEQVAYVLLDDYLQDLANNQTTKFDIVSSLSKAYNVTDLNELIVLLVKKIGKLSNIINDNTTSLVVKHILKTFITDQDKLKDVINKLDAKLIAKINQFIDVDLLINLISNEFSNEFVSIVNIFVDALFRTISNSENVNTINDLFKLLLNNIDQERVIKLIENSLQKILNNNQIINSVSTKIKELLLENDLIDDTQEITDGIKALVGLVPKINEKLKFISPLVKAVFTTLNNVNDIKSFGEEFKKHLNIKEIIDPNNLKPLLSILNEKYFIDNKKDLKALFTSVVEKIWSNDTFVSKLISGINFGSAIDNSKIITSQELKDFIINHVYKDSSQVNLKNLLTNIIDDLFADNATYAKANNIFEIIKIYLAKTNYESTNKQYVINLVGKVVDHTNILPNFLFKMFGDIGINFVEGDRPVIQKFGKELFKAIKDSQLFTDIINLFYEQIASFNYTNNIGDDFKKIIDNVLTKFIKTSENKIDVTKIVDKLIPQITNILNTSNFDAKIYTKFFNLLFERSVYDKNEPQGIYKIIHDLIYVKGEANQASFNIFTLLNKAPKNIPKLITALITPIARSYMLDVRDSLNKPFDIYQNKSFHAVNRLTTLLLWFLKDNAGAIFWKTTLSIDLHIMVKKGVDDAFAKAYKEANLGLSYLEKNKFYLNKNQFIGRVYGSTSLFTYKWNYDKDQLLAYINWYKNADRWHSGSSNADNLWYLFVNGHLKK